MLFAAINEFWYALPLVVTISLVYSATRFERMDMILSHSLRVGGWIVGCMFVVFAVLFVISSRL
jgi:hypothetical protein